MTVEVRPLGVTCNLSCHYCYQNPQRDAGNQRMSYDMEKMKAALKRHGRPFSLFGGEPLMMRFEDLEELFAWGFAQYGKASIQTNGVLIEDRHVELFRRYKVDIGISLDGPGALNDARWHKGLEKTRRATAAVESAIAKLCQAGLPVGLIITLHRGNATADKLPAMQEWLRRLDAIGVRSARLHLLEVDEAGVRNRLALTPAENIAALNTFAAFEPTLKSLRFDIYREIEDLLMGRDDHATCTWRACDPYTTPAVQGVEGNGDSSNCGRTNKAGISFIKADRTGFERYLALQRTPQERNGCAGCRFFLMCKGQCPGTAIDGDWRNRTEHCTEWKHLFVQMEQRLIQAGKTPLTLQPLRLVLEREIREHWLRGRNPSLGRLIKDFQASLDRPALEPPARQRPARRPRISWVSNEARATWRPRLPRLAAMVEEMTLHEAAAAEGRCAIRGIPDTSFRRMLELARRRGLAAVVLPRTAVPRLAGPLPDDGSGGILVAGSATAVARARSAFTAGDTAGLHAVLNLPACCLEAAADDAGRGDSHIPADIAFHGLLAPLGLSILPIAACSADCSDAAAAARRWLAAAEAHGFAEEASWLRDCLAWNQERSELNGVIEIRTPVFRMCAYDETATGPRRVSRVGTAVVGGAPAGLSFPHAAPARTAPGRLMEAVS